MPIVNIVDKRNNCYDVRCDVEYYPSEDDNAMGDATQFDGLVQILDWRHEAITEVIKIYETTVVEALELLHEYPHPLTMIIYGYQTQRQS